MSMRGMLHLEGPDGPIDLQARIVPHRVGHNLRYSWHGRLGGYEGSHGKLSREDGVTVAVVVSHGYLDVEP